MVLWQVRWAELSHLRDDSMFREAINGLQDPFDEYPFYSEANEFEVQVTPGGVFQKPGRPVARWESSDRRWLIIVSAQSLTICRLNDYESFDEFSCRASSLLTKILEKFKIPEIERVGVRYVNRISGKRIDSISDYFPRLEGKKQFSSKEVKVIESMSAVTMQVDNVRLHVRAGMIQPMETVDPAIVPLQEESWVLDLDATVEERTAASIDSLLETIGRLADLNYDYYLWCRGAEDLASETGGK